MTESRQVLTQFLSAWKKLDHGSMFANSQLTMASKYGLGAVKDKFKEPIKTYRVINVKKQSQTVHDYKLKLVFKNGSEKTTMARVLCEKASYILDADGMWGVNYNSITKWQ